MIYFIYLVMFYFSIIVFLRISYPELRWNWNLEKDKKLNFPKNFFWGTATASHQVEGNCKNNNWYNWENNFNSDGKPRIKDNQKAGLACDHWNRFKDDVSLLKELGVSHYRLSLEWSKIETEKNKFNEDALNHYSEVIDFLLENNIVPYVTLHHFTNPIWFDELGSFEKEKNIDFFINFCKLVFNRYSDKVSNWCTINEPEVYSVMGYFSGIFPPGKKDAQLSAEVQKNLLIAHTRVYHKLKSLPNGKKCKIGIVKNVMQFDPSRRWHLLDWLACRITDTVYNKMSLSYLKYGKIKINIPFFINIDYTNKDAVGATDFFGLNYYSHVHLKFQFDKHEFFTNTYPKNDIMTDMPYTIYPEGLYRAIRRVKSINKPIIITENGIADSKDDRRGLFIKRYIYAVNKAIEDDIDVRGYFYWSLMDNFEWAEGYDMKFGLYEVDFKTQERKLREGSKEFIKIINESK
tara:strand:+ start:14919 stop:16304 length:1386 start_codon:yes stop_codon:yes gene_type:complete